MAKAKKPTTKKSADSQESSTVIRISASDNKGSTKKAKRTTKAAKTSTKKSPQVSKTDSVSQQKKNGILRSFFGYFIGAWHELKLVRWPNRKATWGLTIAVLLFSAFFVIFILLLDAGFKYLFELMYRQ